MRTIAWNAPSAEDREYRLSSNAVDVWRVSLDDCAPASARAMRSLLSADERTRAGGFHFERDRGRYVVGRGVLRLLLGRYLKRAPHSIAFCYGPYGKPVLAGNASKQGGLTPAPPPLHFNLAHSDGLAVYAFARAGEVGVDIERVRELPEWESMAETTFSPRELAELRAVPAADRQERFFAAWTRQEAVLKALGAGLGGAAPGTTAAEYRVASLRVADGFAAALTTPPAVTRIAYRTWCGDGALGAASDAGHRTEPATMGAG